MEKRALLQQQIVPCINRALSEPTTSDSTKLQLSEITREIDPLNEPATQAIMHYRASSGDTAGALAAYQRLCHEMDTRQGMEPSTQTQEQAVLIKNGDSTQNNKSQQDTRPWVFVQPPETGLMSGSQKGLLIGFYQELLAGLIRFREWRIGDFQQSQTHTERPQSSAFLLTFTPIEQTDSLRLIVTLKDLQTDTYLWSERVEHSVDNWLQCQSELVQSLAHSLNVQISDERLRQISGRENFKLNVYDKWLLAESKTAKFKQIAWLEARDVLRELMVSEPKFSRAYSSLAQMDNAKHFVFPGILSNPERRQRALGYAKRSVELDPQDSRNQLCLAWALSMKGQFPAAKNTFILASTLNENDPWTKISSALGLAFCHDTDSARMLSDKAFRIDRNPPPLHWAYQAAIAFLREDYGHCIECSHLAEDAMSDVRAWQSAALALAGDTEQARSCLHDFIAETRDDWHGEKKPSSANIANWLLNCFPIRHLAAWQKLSKGLGIAGLDIQNPIPPLGSSD